MIKSRRISLGPLAKEAGGLGVCKDFRFATTDDPRYRAALAVIKDRARELREHPREDMCGAKPRKKYTVW